MHLALFAHLIIPIKHYIIHNVHASPFGLYMTTLLTKPRLSLEEEQENIKAAIKEEINTSYIKDFCASKERLLLTEHVKKTINNCLIKLNNHLSMRSFEDECPEFKETDFNIDPIQDLSIDPLPIIKNTLIAFVDSLLQEYPFSKQLKELEQDLRSKTHEKSALLETLNKYQDLKLNFSEKKTLQKIFEVVATILTVGGYLLIKYGLFNNNKHQQFLKNLSKTCG